MSAASDLVAAQKSGNYVAMVQAMNALSSASAVATGSVEGQDLSTDAFTTLSNTYGRLGVPTVGSRCRGAALKAFRRNSISMGPMSVPPAISASTSAIDATLTKQYRTASGDTGQFRVTGGIAQQALSAFSAYRIAPVLHTANGLSGNTSGDSTTSTNQWSWEFMTDGPRVQLVILRSPSVYMIEVDDQPVQAAGLTFTTGGGTEYILLTFSVGSAAIVAATGVFTVTPPTGVSGHGLQVGDQVVLGTVTTTTGITASTVPYYVLTTPSATTLTLSATPGGAAVTLTGDGSVASIAKAGSRKVRVEFPTGAGGFQGVDVGPTYSVWAPADEYNVKVVHVGDSVGTGTQTGLPNGAWQKILGKILGWTDVRQVSIGSTGFTTNGGSAAKNTFGDALRVSDVVSHTPDMVIISASQNDTSQSGVQAAALAAFQAYRTALPSVPIVVTGANPGSGGPSVALLANENSVKAAFDQWADSNSFWIPISTDTTGAWFSGTGNTGALAGTGNADRYMYTDGAHPNDAGHLIWGRRMAEAFRTLVLPTLR